jgi:DNA-binding NarL/FixJ family response regulator
MNRPALALIAAPPDSLRYSLQALLTGLPSIDAVQSVEDTRSMLDVLTDTQPKLVVLDVNLLGSETRPLLALIKAIAPRTHTVVLVDTIEQQQTLRSTSADVILLKGYPAAELFGGIERLLVQDDPDIDR